MDPFSLVKEEIESVSERLRRSIFTGIPTLRSAAEYFFKVSSHWLSTFVIGFFLYQMHAMPHGHKVIEFPISCSLIPSDTFTSGFTWPFHALCSVHAVFSTQAW